MPPPGQFCLPGPRPRAGAAARQPSVYTVGAMAVPDRLLDGPERANPQCDDQGLPRSPATSVHPHPVRLGLLSLDEACARYLLTVDEFLSWQHSVDRHGL